MASRISHNASRSLFSFSRWTVTRASGNAMSVRIERIVAATINSIRVKPRVFLAIDLFWALVTISTLLHFKLRKLLHRHRSLRPVDGDRLQPRITCSTACDGKRSLSGGPSLESYRDNGSLAGNSAGAAGPRGSDLRLTHGFVLAMDESDNLSVLREESSIRHVHQLQHFGVIVQLNGNRIDILCAGDQQVHGKGVALFRLNLWRIEQEAGIASGIILTGRLRGCWPGGLIRCRTDRDDRWISSLAGLSGRGRRRDGWPGRMVQLDRGCCSDVDRALIHFVDVGGADDVRNDSKNDFVFGMILGGLAEEVFKDRNLCQARNSAQLLGLLVFHNAAQQVSLAIFQADFVLRSEERRVGK